MDQLQYAALPQRELRNKRRRAPTVDSTLASGEPQQLPTSDSVTPAHQQNPHEAGTAQLTQQEHGHPSGQQRDVGDAVHAQPSEEVELSKQPADGQTSPSPASRYTTVDTPVYRSHAVGNYKFEYLDHTADVQLHSWGTSLNEAFEQVALAMFNYMTPLEGLRIDESQTRQYTVQGHDLHSLLFAFLDELLFVFSTEMFAAKEVRIDAIVREGEELSITATGRGETFDRARHEAGTEIKAITYSAMQIVERPGDCDVWVIVDI